MANNFGRDLEREIKKEADRLVAVAQSGAQRDLDSLLAGASNMGVAEVRAKVADIFKRHGFDAPASEIDRCTSRLVAGERVVLTWDVWKN